MKTIETLRFWCHKILPLVYDESLSYYEVLCKFRAKLNEMVDAINQQNMTIEEFTETVENWEKEVEDKIDEKIEEGLADLEQRLSAEFELWFNTFKSESEESISTMVAEYTGELESELSEFQADFNTAMTSFTNTFNTWFAQQEQMIQETVEDYADRYLHNLEDRIDALDEEVTGTGGLSDEVSGLTTAVGVISNSLNHLMELTTITRVMPVPTTHTSYEIHWYDYDFIIIEPVHWWNAYGNAWYHRQRIADSVMNEIELCVYDSVNQTSYSISKVDNTHLYVKASGNHANETNYGLRIYGIKVKGE